MSTDVGPLEEAARTSSAASAKKRSDWKKPR
jgi:hypothetical protein